MSLSGLRVLLAEDNPTNQMVVTQMLLSLGAKVTLAVDGAEALEKAAVQEFDVMLIDIEMPRVTGIEVIRQLRAERGPVSEVPMIALTAYVMREHRIAIDAAGADGLIPKPILSVEEFGRDIERYSARRWANHDTPGTSAGVADDSDGIDMAIYQSLIDAVGAESMPELLEKVEADISNAGARVRLALQKGDLGDLRAATHILVSVGGAIGARTLQALALRMTRAAQTQDEVAIETDADRIIAEIDAALSFVRGKR